MLGPIMRITKQLLFLFIIISATMASCNSEDVPLKKTAQGKLYLDAKITGEEAKEAVTILVLFKNGPNGPAIALGEDATVTLDGETLAADSTEKFGVFYETQRRLDEFAGAHILEFSDGDREVKQEFDFIPFALKDSLPTVLKRNDLVFQLEGLEAKEPIHVVMTDTGFITNDINSVDTLLNGQLVVERQRLANLKNGPISFQLYKDVRKRLRKDGKEWGQITTSYGLMREFILTD